MSAIMKLRQARNVEQIAEELEPLATSLATLADQAQTSIQNLEKASKDQAIEWSSQQQGAATAVANAAQTLNDQVKALQQSTNNLQQTIDRMQRAQRRTFWTQTAITGISATLAAALSIGLWLWLAPSQQVQNQLDPKAVADFLKPAIQDALKRK
jgi:uncharacterized protein YdiU (UPF0061 family)